MTRPASPTEPGLVERLEPCPFCGGEAEIERRGSARQSTIYACTDCGCRLETGEVFNLGERWNRRALRSPLPDREGKDDLGLPGPRTDDLNSTSPPSSGDALKEALEALKAERLRQIEAEGWAPDHDDHHDKGELACAAAAYALRSADCDAQARMAWGFTRWGASWFKPTDKDPRRMLVKAGALILAEIERLDRLALSQPQSSRGTGE